MPELPFIAAGAIALISGFLREKKFPENGSKALIGTAVLVLTASATANTSLAPLIRAIGLLILLATVMRAVPAFTAKRK